MEDGDRAVDIIDTRDMIFRMGIQILENQNALMRRFSTGWTDDGAAELCKRIGETSALMISIRKLGP